MRKNVNNAVNQIIKSLNRRIEFNVVKLVYDEKTSLIDLESYQDFIFYYAEIHCLEVYHLTTISY